MVFQKIDEKSTNAITSALDFFTIPPTNTSVSAYYWREYLTLNPITDVPYRFRIYASNNYLDLTKVYLLSEMKIQKYDTTNSVWRRLTATGDGADKVGTINFIGATFIRNIKITLNGREIYDSNSMYAYKAYLDAELSLPTTVKDSYLSAAGYYRETTTEHNPDSDDNPGFKQRKLLFDASKTVQFISKIDADLFNQPNYMISGVEIEIEIMPNDSAFCLLEPSNTGTAYRLEITALRLYVKTLELMSGLAYEISQKLEKQPARYAIRRTAITSNFISENRTEFTTLLWSEQIPRRVIVGLVENKRYIGNKAHSPFYFQPFSTRELTIYANGRTYPSNLYNLDYTNKLYTRAFHETSEALGFANSLETNGINFERFGDGWTIYVFNLTNSGEENPCFDLITEGATTINIKFSTPIPAGGIVLVALAEFDSLIYIDRNRSVLSDYNA